MQRHTIQPRRDWQKIVEEQGFHFHSMEAEPYWAESAYYSFTVAEIDELERATYKLNELCLAAVQHVIDYDLFELYSIPKAFWPLIKRSWEEDEITIYGRFDLAFDGSGPPKLLEYNADTPTALIEAAVIQWKWMKDRFPSADQFNSIHEQLIEAWKRVKTDPRAAAGVHFACINGNLEDFLTTQYLRDTAIQAGLKTEFVEVERVGWNARRQLFVDETERHIAACFKLYPWEWMIHEPFAEHLLQRNTWWLETPWKMLLSNKALLAVLYKLFPDSPYLLPASFEPLAGRSFVKKPTLSREGANVTLVINGQQVEATDGDYGDRFVYQQYQPLANFADRHAVIGSWMVNGYACGIGIREDRSRITQNTSRFVPHICPRSS